MLNARTLLLVCLASGLWAFGFGLGSQVVTHWLTARDAGDTVIGLSHSFYYFGLAVASCAVPWLTRRLGATACASFGMIASGLTLAAFPWSGAEAAWYLLRFLNGCAGALSLVPLETIVSKDSLPERKTQNFAFYGVALTVGGALGIGLGLSPEHPGEAWAFYFGGAVPVIAGMGLALLLRREADAPAPEGNAPLAWRQNFLSYGTAWCQGFLEGGMLAFLSLFLIARGFSTSMAGTLMGLMMVGVIAFQIPVSWLADRYGKTPILLGCYAVVAAGLGAIPFLTDEVALAGALFAFGACTGAMYPLGLSRLSDNMPDSGLARAYAWYLAIECVGSQAGAALMGAARDHFGDTVMFQVGLAAVCLVLVLWVVVNRPWTAFDRRAARTDKNESRQESSLVSSH